MMLSVDNVEELVASVLVRRNDRFDIFLDLLVGDAALKWTILSLQSRANVLSNLGEVDDLSSSLLLNIAGNERLSGE